MPLTPSRTVEELRELRELTGDENGAQRVAWTETWERGRAWLREKIAPTGAAYELDQAGNQWFTLPGRSEQSVLIGGHMDSAPNGGRAAGWPNAPAPGRGAERGLARRLPQRARGGRGAAPDRRGGRAAGDRAARRLGRRGRRALRSLALRLLGRGRLDARPGGAREADRPRRRDPPLRAPGARDRPEDGRPRAAAVAEREGLPRAAHRAGPGARVDGSSARRRARHLRRRALPDHLARPGRACGLDADGQA